MRCLPLRDESYRAILTAFEGFLRNEGYAKGSLYQLPSAVREFLHQMEEHGIMRLDLIGPEEIQAHYEYLRKRPNARRAGGLSSQMLSHHVFALRTFLAWLVRLEAIPFDPMTGLDFPRPSSLKRGALTEEEVGAMYAASENKLDRALLCIYYGCGLRRQEGVDLDVQDIDLHNARLIVREGKYAKRREIPFPARVQMDLTDYVRSERPLRVRLEVADGKRAFLLNSLGRRLTGAIANRRVQELAVIAGITEEVTLHRLRHSIATHMKERGMGMETIQQFLGHGSLDVTQAYITGYRLHWKKELPYHQQKRHELRGIPDDPLPESNGGALHKSTWRVRQTDR